MKTHCSGWLKKDGRSEEHPIIHTRTKIAAMKTKTSAACETGREGKSLTSTSEPSCRLSVCQPGKVARRMKVMKAKTIAMILEEEGEC